jgi:hypothetical protein
MRRGRAAGSSNLFGRKNESDDMGRELATCAGMRPPFRTRSGEVLRVGVRCNRLKGDAIFCREYLVSVDVTLNGSLGKKHKHNTSERPRCRSLAGTLIRGGVGARTHVHPRGIAQRIWPCQFRSEWIVSNGANHCALYTQKATHSIRVRDLLKKNLDSHRKINERIKKKPNTGTYSAVV